MLTFSFLSTAGLIGHPTQPFYPHASWTYIHFIYLIILPFSFYVHRHLPSDADTHRLIVIRLYRQHRSLYVPVSGQQNSVLVSFHRIHRRHTIGTTLYWYDVFNYSLGSCPVDHRNTAPGTGYMFLPSTYKIKKKKKNKIK